MKTLDAIRSRRAVKHFDASHSMTEEEINDFFREKAKDPKYNKVLNATAEPLVSIDFQGDPHSSTVDLQMTQVVDGTHVKLICWYDNEWGYANRLVDMVKLIHNVK